MIKHAFWSSALLLLIAATCTAWAATGTLEDVVSKIQEITGKQDLTTAAKVERLKKIKPMIVSARGKIVDVTPTTTVVTVPTFRQLRSGTWVEAGTINKTVPAIRVDVVGDNLAIGGSDSLVGTTNRWFLITPILDQKTAATWGRGDELEWSERITVLDTAQLGVEILVDKLSDLKRTPKPAPRVEPSAKTK